MITPLKSTGYYHKTEEEKPEPKNENKEVESILKNPSFFGGLYGGTSDDEESEDDESIDLSNADGEKPVINLNINLTPRECLLFMGFTDDDYENIVKKNPEIHKNSVLFPRDKIIRMAGNSIPVKLLEGIFYQIIKFDEQLENN